MRRFKIGELDALTTRGKGQRGRIPAGLTQEEIEALVVSTQENPHHCYLCGDLTYDRSVFFPADPAYFNIDPEKDIAIIYPFCHEHVGVATEADMDKVERRIKRERDAS